MAITTPVLYYKLDGNSNDSIGSNNGTDTSITYSTGNGKINQGAGADAGTDRIYIGNPSALQISGAQTINFWIKASSQGANSRSIFSSGGIDGASDGSIYMFHYSGQNIDFGVSNGTTISVAALSVGQTSSLLDGSFHMVTLTYTPSTKVEIFIDATSTVSNTTSIISSRTTTKNWSIFAIETDQSATRRDSITGAIDEFGVWNVVLSGSEIAELYNGGAGIQYPFTSANKAAFFNLM